VEANIKYLYDQLVQFESAQRADAAYPIHKKLNFSSREETQSFQDITDWLAHYIDIPADAHILDAGCGVGYTLLSLCENTERTGVGISLSPEEINRANAAAKNKKLAQQCSFKVHSFNEPLDARFDLIIAIESLKHSVDLKQTLARLSSALKPEGQLVIIEDFLTSEVISLSLKKRFEDYWHLQDTYAFSFYEKELNKHKLRIKNRHDFTPLVSKKSALKVISKYYILRTLSLLPHSRTKELSRIFGGGFLMDYFYAKGNLTYELLLAKATP